MEPRKLLEILDVAERLKDATRHCYTSNGRHESVAEHCWMMTLMAFFLREEFPDVDMNKVIEMCILTVSLAIVLLYYNFPRCY